MSVNLNPNFSTLARMSRNVGLEIAIDEDMPLRGSDQIIREAFASDVIEIPAMRNGGNGSSNQRLPGAYRVPARPTSAANAPAE